MVKGYPAAQAAWNDFLRSGNPNAYLRYVKSLNLDRMGAFLIASERPGHCNASRELP
jgi:hypothetical protein